MGEGTRGLLFLLCPLVFPCHFIILLSVTWTLRSLIKNLQIRGREEDPHLPHNSHKGDV